MIKERVINGLDQLSLINENENENVYISHWIEKTVPLDNIPGIESLRLSAKKRSGLSGLTKLKYLDIVGLKNNEGIENLINLEELAVIKGNITNLNFLNKMPKLRTLSLSFLYKLTDVSGLISMKNSLERLEIEACKNINWQDELLELRNLRRLILVGFTFDDLNWVKKLPKLEHLSIVGCIVINGDISPLNEINYVGIDNRRDYNYKFDHGLMKIIPKD